MYQKKAAWNIVNEWNVEMRSLFEFSYTAISIELRF